MSQQVKAYVAGTAAVTADVGVVAAVVVVGVAAFLFLFAVSVIGIEGEDGHESQIPGSHPES